MKKIIKLEDKKLFEYLTKKSTLIEEGRGISTELEKIDTEMEELDKLIQDEEKKVDITDLTDKEKEITERVQKCIDDMNSVKKEIFKRMDEKVDHTLHAKYETLKKEKEEKEELRNKTAIKAQKYNDKIIPLTRKLMTPFLEDEFDDYETIKIEDGEIVGTIFNHLDEFKTNFKK